MFWNADGLRSRAALFRAFLSEQDVDIGLVCETHLRTADRLHIPGYHVYRQDETSHAGRAYRGLAVLVRRRLVHQPVQAVPLASMSALGVEVCVAGDVTRVFAAYKAPQTRLQVADVRKLLDSPLPTIIAGDLNCKHPAWNSSCISPDGRRLFDDAEREGYCVTGPAVPTHYPYIASHNPDVIDVVVHRGLSSQPELEVLYDLNSDHCPVLAVLALEPTVARAPAPTRRIDRRHRRPLDRSPSPRRWTCLPRSSHPPFRRHWTPLLVRLLLLAGDLLSRPVSGRCSTRSGVYASSGSAPAAPCSARSSTTSALRSPSSWWTTEPRAGSAT